MDIRRRIAIALLAIGAVAGYSSGIYSAVRHARDGGGGCHGRHGHAGYSWSYASPDDDGDENGRAGEK